MDPRTTTDALPCPHVLFSSGVAGDGYCLGCGLDAVAIARPPVAEVEATIEEAERFARVWR